MGGNIRLVLESYRVMTALRLSTCRTCEEEVDNIHQALAYELADAYMLEHGYGRDVNGNFVEKQEIRL